VLLRHGEALDGPVDQALGLLTEPVSEGELGRLACAVDAVLELIDPASDPRALPARRGRLPRARRRRARGLPALTASHLPREACMAHRRSWKSLRSASRGQIPPTIRQVSLDSFPTSLPSTR
jgi:hypothetical protein